MIDLRVGDCRSILPTLPAESVHCCVTSPPYWGLRDYGHAAQIGLEPTVEAFVGELVAVFREVRRVLRDDGTLWLNLGDSYAGAPGGWQGKNGERASRKFTARIDQEKRGPGLKSKDLVGVPWRVAFALQADGWWLRSDIIWAKPNPMPESIKDRPTKAHEYLFLLAKSERYYYDAAAIAEPTLEVPRIVPPSGLDTGPGSHATVKHNTGTKRERKERSRSSDTEAKPVRNKRTVWSIATQPTPDAHFATFPRKLVEPCILAGSRPGDVVLDPFAGTGTVGRAAADLGRRALLVELNPEYAAMAERKTAQLGLVP